MKNFTIHQSNIFGNYHGILFFKNFLQKNKNRKIFILVDSNTENYCLSFFYSLFNISKKSFLLRIPAGESSKSLAYVSFLFDELITHQADNDSLLINLGGGVVSDLGGFVASTFNRGMSYINFPTTLLAQVDASIGGKTGVNFKGIKNKIGLINNPIFTIVLTEFIKTLPEQEFLSGYGEICKYGLICNPSIWEYISKYKINILDDPQYIIYQSIKIKTDIVHKDNNEKGLRKILNFGHTIGHAIESVCQEISLKHGICVVMGMICELYISHILLKLPKQKLDIYVKVLNSNFALKKIKNTSQIISLIRHDKKNQKGKLLFSLISKIGHCHFNQEVSENLIDESLTFYNSLYNE